MATFPDGLTSNGLESTWDISVSVVSPVVVVDTSDPDTEYVYWYSQVYRVGIIGTGSYADFNAAVLSDSTTSLGIDSIGTCIGDYTFLGGTTRLTLRSSGGNNVSFYTQPNPEGLIKWSNIGSSDFTIWEDNIAGERTLDWKGAVYAILKLGSKAIAYGENGVSILAPSGNTYGLQTIYRVGLIGKDAVAGDTSSHYFIDNSGQLFSIGENKMKATLFESNAYPELLGYEEYLSELSSPVLSWDKQNNLLYICDGYLGFVYSPKSKSLGSGPVNITGIDWQGGMMYVAAPTAITIPPFEMCTDIYDFGTHKYKTVHQIEVGTNVTGTLQVALDYRSDYSSDFNTTSWKDVMASGKCYITALGREIRIRLRINTYEYFEIDYVTVKGIIHDQ